MSQRELASYVTTLFTTQSPFCQQFDHIPNNISLIPKIAPNNYKAEVKPYTFGISFSFQ